ncbi:hypothetical protein OG216_16840 [Streptomycetaceae bacterium NBC_01309]
MTGRDEGQWMRERFELGIGDLPDIPAPHETIVRRGRARRRTRNAVAGSVASVLVVAGLVAGFTLPGGGGESTATDPIPPPPPTSTAPPQPSTTPPNPLDLGRVKLTDGQLEGHGWELVRVRTEGEYQEESYVLPGGRPTGAPETRQGYCETFEIVVDGTKIGNSGPSCGSTPNWATAEVVPGQVNFLTLEVDDKPDHTALSLGTLGAVTWGFLSPNVDHVRVTFKDTGKTEKLEPQHVPGVSEPFYVLVVPHKTGTERNVDLVAYDAAGKPVAQTLNRQVSAD